MPLFEFECAACGASFEELAAAGTTPACPACGSDRVARRWSPVAPAGLGVARTGRAAAESNARRGEREAKRQAGFAEDRKRRRST
ncbi:MAG TPA: zinc ribbon domain-containing protein [Thermoleophilaceae bacterium]